MKKKVNNSFRAATPPQKNIRKMYFANIRWPLNK